MRPMRCLLFAALVAMTPPSAFATTVLDFQGFGWETGGFPPSAAGDTLRIPCVVDSLSQALGIDLGSFEVTGFISDLVSSGSQPGPGGVQVISYSSAHIAFYRDAARDHDYGTNPPNATAPSSFTNGTLCLGGSLDGFVLFFDPATGSGAYEGNVSFTEGDCLGQLQALRADGFTFGGVLSRDAAAGNVPEGYDLSVDGFIQVQETGIEACDLKCFGLEEVEMDFPKKAPKHFGNKDGRFEIEGQFNPCPDIKTLDPTQQEILLRIGSYDQTFPAGSLQRRSREPGESHGPEFVYSNSRGTSTITELEIEFEDDGAWEFEIHGRGIPRNTLLDGLTLRVELTIGDMHGSTEERLNQGKKQVSFQGDDEPCEDEDAVAHLPVTSRQAESETQPSALVPAEPNPFNATTSIVLRTLVPGDVSLRIYDVRGRLVNTLQEGALGAGSHRFVWDGTDTHGENVSSGVYFYRAVAPGYAGTLKMILAK